MSDQAIEKLITNAIHTAFIKYPRRSTQDRARPVALMMRCGRRGWWVKDSVHAALTKF